MKLIFYMARNLLLVLCLGCASYAQANELSLRLMDEVDVCVDEDTIVKKHFIREWWTELLAELMIALPAKEGGPSVAKISFNTFDNSDYFNDIKSFAKHNPKSVDEDKSLGLLKINFNLDLSKKTKSFYEKMEAGTGDVWFYVTPDFMVHKSTAQNLIPPPAFFSICNVSSDRSGYKCERRIYSDGLILSYEITDQELKQWKSIDMQVSKELKSLVRQCN